MANAFEYSNRTVPDDAPVATRRPPHRYLKGVIAALVAFFTFKIFDIIVWHLLGQPLMFVHAISEWTLLCGTLIGVATAFASRSFVGPDNRLATGVFGGALAVLLIYHGGIVVDFYRNALIGQGRLHVIRVDQGAIVNWQLPFARGAVDLRPTALVLGPEWMTLLHVPGDLVKDWRPGATCLDISVRRGASSTTFVSIDRTFAADWTDCTG